MTTIATDGKSMAGDGQREMCHTITGTRAEKVRRLSDGRLAGTCGDTAFGIALIEWLNGEGEKPTDKPEDGFQALILNLDGSIEMMGTACVLIPVDAPAAIGSGMDFAIGAMEAGKTPEEAVAIAAKRDPGTGGTIAIMRPTIRAVA